LAPSRETARNLNLVEGDIVKQTPTGQNENEINYYDLDDPFIDDEEALVCSL
jgi:hypothetical protein